MGLVPRHHMGRHLGFSELANHLAQETLGVPRPQVHRWRTLSRERDPTLCYHANGFSLHDTPDETTSFPTCHCGDPARSGRPSPRRSDPVRRRQHSPGQPSGPRFQRRAGPARTGVRVRVRRYRSKCRGRSRWTPDRHVQSAGPDPDQPSRTAVLRHHRWRVVSGARRGFGRHQRRQ